MNRRSPLQRPGTKNDGPEIVPGNLGDQIKSKNLQDASWLPEGMDSILHILNKKLKEHRKLFRPVFLFLQTLFAIANEGHQEIHWSK